MCVTGYLQQEPASSPEELINGIRYVRPGKDFQPNFVMTKKIEVNGDNEHPLFTYLKVSLLFILLK